MAKNGGGGGVKVTYIETQFVSSDAAGFKDLVQRLTGRSAPVPGAAAAVPHRPRPCRAGAGDDGRRSAPELRADAFTAGGHAPPCLQVELHEMGEFAELLYVNANRWRGEHGGGGYSDFTY
ncbi:hypothetical protein ACP70R_029354 [Stipagrostis hirtigluma subsp. patula]